MESVDYFSGDFGVEAYVFSVIGLFAWCCEQSVCGEES